MSNFEIAVQIDEFQNVSEPIYALLLAHEDGSPSLLSDLRQKVSILYSNRLLSLVYTPTKRKHPCCRPLYSQRT